MGLYRRQKGVVMSTEVRLFRALGVADGGGVIAAPGAVLAASPVDGGLPRLLACGRSEDVQSHEAAAGASVIDLPDVVLLPGLVNAHTHLDLTHIGPRDFHPGGGFVGWARMIIGERLRDSRALRDSVSEGVRRSLAGGVVAVGDIAGVMQLDPIDVLRESGLLGVSFIEYFGVGARQEATIAQVGAFLESFRGAAGSPARVGLQPHAPYTAGLRVFQWTAEQASRGVPLCTHLAEGRSEHEFVARGGGAFRAFLESMGFWDSSVLDEVGKGKTPIDHLAGVLRRAPWLVAHVNDCDDAGLRVLAETRTSVAYCPRSSWYFLNHEAFGPHRYRDMLRAGVNVCLGTDSIVNLPKEESDCLSTLDEMRFLHRRDGTDSETLLNMATVNGARALGLEESLFSLRLGEIGPHAIAGLIGVRVPARAHASLLDAVMSSIGLPRVLATPNGLAHSSDDFTSMPLPA